MALHPMITQWRITSLRLGAWLSACLSIFPAAGCEGDGAGRGDAGATNHSGAGSSSSAGTFANGGTADAGGGTGTSRTLDASSAVAIDASVLETCPVAAPRPQDGEWTTRGEIIATACPADFPLGAEDTRFAQVTIKTAALEGRIDRDLNLSTPQGEVFRGYVQDDQAVLSGPLANYPDKPLDVRIFFVFSGYCFTASAYQVLQTATGPCEIRSYLVGARVGAP